MVVPESSGASKKRSGGRRTGRDPIAQGASAVIGVVVVAVLGLAALLVAPGLVKDGAQSGGQRAVGATGLETQVGGEAAVPTGEVTMVTVRVDGMAFTPSTLEVPVGNTLQVIFENTGDQRHDLLFDDGSLIEAIAPGQSAEVTVGPISQDMEGWCTLPGHRQMGMQLSVIAVGDAASGDAGLGAGSHAGHVDPQASTAINMMALLEEAGKHDPHPAALEPLPPSEGTVTREFTFEVAEDEENLVEGVVRPLWTYNGSSPGPTLRGRVGDQFVITLVNNGTMGHSIDFHAGQNAPDDVMATIEPGESLEYRFKAERSGIWMYHCSTMPMSLHIANGMFGAVIIDPEDLGDVDREYLLIQSEFYGEEGALTASDKAAALTPDVVMFNGRAFQYDVHPLEANVGERVRFWVLDVGPNSPLSFHVVGTQFDTWWSEGRYGVHLGHSTDGITLGTTGAQVLPLQAAQGGFVELVATEPGNYAIVNHVMSLAEKGASGTLSVK